MRFYIVAGLILAVAAGRGDASEVADGPTPYEKNVSPFLKVYCAKCHAGEKPKGQFSTAPTRLANDFRDADNREKWAKIVDVLNAHEMPPEKAPQPSSAETARVVDWITEQMMKAELTRRERGTVLRRLNRNEYRNTIRDLVGVDFDPAGFPEDPLSGGFDTNGAALTVSPFHLENYLAAAGQIADRALVSGNRPAAVRWRFDLIAGPMDARKVRADEHNPHVVVNGNNNKQEKSWVVVRRDYWDTWLGARSFHVPVDGVYAIRIHAAGRVPRRDDVVASADRFLRQQRDENIAKQPSAKPYLDQRYRESLVHFKTDPMYEYGPPRLKLVQQLGSQPRTIAEFDVDSSPSAPKTFTYLARFTTESAGITINYAYSVPRTLENFQFYENDAFPRPEALVDWIEIEGPIHDAWPPPSHTGILFPVSKGSTELVYVRKVLERFLRRAYRRPVTTAEVDAKLALYRTARRANPYLESVKIVIAAALVSPHFLYLVEPSTDEKGDQPSALNDHQIAARLSYFLWSSMPDDRLFSLADDRKLHDADTLRLQVDRMLADAKAEALAHDFAGQWLGLREVGLNPPTATLYPHYDRHLETSIVGEAEAYFREFLVNDIDIRQMIRSDFVVINERLARFYGIPDVRGDTFRRVKVPEGVHRGGLLTQASMLTITSNGTRTSPVKRGTWILKTLLGTDPGLPVANVGEIAPKVPGIDKATVRQRLEIHRTLPQCARCHGKIDPLGFALENYDAGGQWRAQEGFGYAGRVEPNDPRIDASSVMPDGTPINGVDGLQRAILKKDEMFVSCLASKMMTYAYGRELGLADQAAVKAVVAETKKGRYTLRALVKAIVTSKSFGTK